MGIFRIEFILEYSFVFVFGLFIGSFSNVLVYRLPVGKSPFWPTWSFCPHCRATIAWFDNIPVVSYLALRAKCRRCGPSANSAPLRQCVFVVNRCVRAMNQVGIPAGIVFSTKRIEISRHGFRSRIASHGPS